MRLSTKGRYAVMAMADLAGLGAGGIAPLAAISARQAISLSYLEQLFARLRRKGLVDSVRGPGGGYRLARAAAKISVSDIVAAVDEPLHAVRCTSEGKGCMPGGKRCVTHDLWDELGRQIHGYLSGVSLDDVIGGRLRRPASAEAA